MQQRKGMFCKVVSIFDVKGGGQAVLLLDMRSGLGEQHYVTDRDNVPSATFVEFPCRMMGDKVIPPEFLIPAWKGDPGGSSRQIRSHYLSYLYTNLLHVSRSGTDKSFDSKIVFSDKKLRIVETIHDRLHSDKLHTLLEETNYRYDRKSIYTRFHDNDDLSFNTPRLLHYYPCINTVKVVWALGGAPKDIEIPAGDGTPIKLEASPVRVNIIRIYKDEGWTSLRDEMRKDPKLHAFARMFYGNGYGQPEDPNHPASKRNR